MSFLKSREFGMFAILILLMGVIAFVNPDAFLSSYNLHNLMRQIGFLAIFSIGVSFVIIAAGIDLSLGSLIAFCGVVASLFLDWTTRLVEQPGVVMNFSTLLAACLIVIAVGALIGAFHGFMIALFDIPPFVVTLGTMCILRSLSYLFTDSVPVPILNEQYNAMGNEGFLSFPFFTSYNRWQGDDPQMVHWVSVPIAFWFCIAVTILSGLVLRYTRFGRNVYAIGGNEQAAYLSGVNVFWTKTGAYAICSALTGVSAVLYSAYDRQGNPSSGLAYELNAIAAAVIGGCSLMGGSGSVLGTLIGASIFTVIINGINLIVRRNASYWEGTIVGIVVIAAVTFNTIRAKRQKI